jgi:hypothetical protein
MIVQYKLAELDLVFAEVWYVNLVGTDFPIAEKLYPVDPQSLVPVAERSKFEAAEVITPNPRQMMSQRKKADDCRAKSAPHRT